MILSMDAGCMFEAPGTPIFIQPQDLDPLGPILRQHHLDLIAGRGDIRDGGTVMTGWMNCHEHSLAALADCRDRVENLRACCDALVIVGIGGSYLGPRALIEACLGIDGRESLKPSIHFLGQDTDPRRARALLRRLQGQRVGGIVISKSGGTKETLVALSLLAPLIEAAPSQRGQRLVVLTGPAASPLRTFAEDLGATIYLVPEGIGGRFSSFSTVGMIPALAAGLPFEDYLHGALAVRPFCNEPSVLDNPAWLYAGLKFLASRKGAVAEYQVSNISDMESSQAFIVQLEAESEGHRGAGLHVLCAQFPRDLHSVGQLIQQGPRNCFEVAVTVAGDQEMPLDASGLGLGTVDLAGLNAGVLRGALAAHHRGGCPSLLISLGRLDLFCLGAYHYAMMEATALQGLLLGHNPFVQPGVTAWKEAAEQLLSATAAPFADRDLAPAVHSLEIPRP